MIQKIKGTMDILPNETPLFRYIEGIMREEAEKYGYGEKKNERGRWQKSIDETPDEEKKDESKADEEKTE